MGEGCEHRESRKILLNIEYRLMLQMAPNYENLTLQQKVEVLEYALDNTTGQDLYPHAMAQICVVRTLARAWRNLSP